MLKLVKKDLLAARWFLLTEWALFVIYVMQPFIGSQFIIILGGILALSNVYQILFIEDRNKTEILYLSLPIKRSTIVGARFLLGFFHSLGALIVFGLIALINAVFRLHTSGPVQTSLLSIEAVVLLLIMSSHFLSLFLVFVYRSGFSRGTVSFILYGTLLAVSGISVLSLVPLDADSMKNSGGFLLASLGTLRRALGTPLFLLAAALLTVVPFLVSLSLSKRFYARREF